MTRACFLVSPLDGTVGFTIQEHAEMGEQGSDILCAAVSSAVYLVVNTITDVFHVTPLTLRVAEGDVFLRLEPKDEPACRDLLTGLKLHLQNLEEQYPEGLRVSYLELDL